MARALFLLCVTAMPAVSQGATPENCPDAAPSRPLSWKGTVRRLAENQWRMWSFPGHVIQGSAWKPALVVSGATGGLILFDPGISSYFKRTSTFEGMNSVFSGRNTSLAMTVLPASFGLLGLVRKDPYAVKTALLAGEAVMDGEILTSVMKNIDHRQRPIAVSQANFKNSWFSDKGWSVGGAGSFPSGHTIAAFSIATIFARRYPKHRWVPYLAYGLAGAIGFSRVSLLSHYSSDVFLAAGLGVSISRFVVLDTSKREVTNP